MRGAGNYRMISLYFRGGRTGILTSRGGTRGRRPRLIKGGEPKPSVRERKSETQKIHTYLTAKHKIAQRGRREGELHGLSTGGLRKDSRVAKT